jgi:hypothetical protein
LRLRRLPDACINQIYIDPPFNRNRNYEVFWGARSEPRTPVRGLRQAFEARRASTTTLNRHHVLAMRPFVRRGFWLTAAVEPSIHQACS